MGVREGGRKVEKDRGREGGSHIGMRIREGGRA